MNTIITSFFLIFTAMYASTIQCMELSLTAEQLQQKIHMLENELAKVKLLQESSLKVIMNPLQQPKEALKEKLQNLHSPEDITKFNDQYSKECVDLQLSEYTDEILDKILQHGEKYPSMSLCPEIKNFLRKEHYKNQSDPVFDKCFQISKGVGSTCGYSSWQYITLFDCLECAEKGYTDHTIPWRHKKNKINQPYGKSGFTPLHIAAVYGSGSLISFLISLGASLNNRDIHGRTPLSILVALQEVERVKFFLKQGALVDFATLFAALNSPGYKGTEMIYVLKNSAYEKELLKYC